MHLHLIMFYKDSKCSEPLIARRLEIPNRCYLCDHNIENIDHVFKKCPFVISIWDRIKYNCPTPLFYEEDFLS